MLPSGASAANPTSGPITSIETSPISYVTMSGPSVSASSPYSFNDGFIPYNESQLQAMSLSSLITYSNIVSTSAGNQNSTILANQNIYNQYLIASQLSQSTINGINNQIQLNNASIYASQQQRAILSQESTMYVSTKAYYNSLIQQKSAVIVNGNSTMQSYGLQISSAYSTIAYDNSTFVSSAIGYSTAYYSYLGWASAFTTQNDTLAAQNISLSSLALAQEIATRNLAVSTAVWREKSSDLSTLNTITINLQSTLTQQRINEANAIFNYNSTINTLSTLSSTYNAAVANNKYALALSTQTATQEAYTTALRTFTRADLLYENSSASGPQGTLWQARSMAQQALYSAEKNKGGAESTTSTLQTLAGIANTDLYATMLSGLEQNVINNMKLANTFMNYKISSLNTVKRWSTVYESAKIDLAAYNDQLKLYSSFYESSMNGSSTLYGLAKLDQSTISGKNLEGTAILATISFLNTNYSNYTSSYNGFISMSTLYKNQIDNNFNNMNTISSLYVSTQAALNSMTAQYNTLVTSNIVNAASVYAQSSILMSERINLATFDAQIKNNVNTLEVSAYSYREIFTRSKALGVQNIYQGQVLQAIQRASTTTGQQQLTTPAAADLTTLGIPETYATLNSINTFISNFTNIYAVYDTQANNIAGLSTSIGYQANAWSTLQKHNDSYFYQTSTDPSLPAKVQAAHTDFSLKKDVVAQILQTYNITQNTIAITKHNFSTAYSSMFTTAEILGQESTISSFMIAGYKQGMANLAANGIIVNL